MYLEKYDLQGRNAVVTGGGRGIGLACATALAEAGAHVVLTDRDEADLVAGKATLAAAGYQVDTGAARRHEFGPGGRGCRSA